MTSLENYKEAQTMSSREIAELTGKMHKHVLEAIRTMEPAWKEVAGTNFRPGVYLDANQQERPCFLLTKTECLFIATKFNDVARAQLILRWEQLENQKLSRKELILMALEAEEARERLQVQNELQAKELKAAAPKVDYYEKVIQSNQAIRTTVIAKDLGMSAGRLNMLLHRMGIQYKVKDTWVLYSDYQGKGYTKSVTHHYTGSDGNAKTSILTCWTQKGREFIMEAVPKYMEKIQSRRLMSVN